MMRGNMGRLHNKVYRFRTECCLSQNELAAMVGLSRNSISSIETGRCQPSAYTAFLLCRALHCKFEDLFFVNEYDINQRTK